MDGMRSKTYSIPTIMPGHHPAQELVSDVHCIIDAMIGKESGISLLGPGTEGVPDVILGDPDRCR